MMICRLRPGTPHDGPSLSLEDMDRVIAEVG